MKRLSIYFILLIFVGAFQAAISQNPPGEISPRQLIKNLKNKEFTGHAIDLDVEATDIVTIIKKFEDISGLQFTVDPDLEINLRKYTFRSAPWDKAIDMIFSDCGLELHLINGAMRVTKASPKKNRISLAFLAGVVSAVAILILALFMFITFKKKTKIKQQEKRFSIEKEKVEEIKKSLIYFLEVEKFYRDDSLSLNKLSERISITPHQLSWVINMKMGQSFSDLINHYRIEEVKKRLVNPADNNLSILDIAFETGFNTKSAFNKTFKTLTGKTPRDYRAKQKPTS